MTQTLHKNPNANATVLAAISNLLRPEIREARGSSDLQHRLTVYGFAVDEGYLVTLPHRKVVCPLSAI